MPTMPFVVSATGRSRRCRRSRRRRGRHFARSAVDRDILLHDDRRGRRRVHRGGRRRVDAVTGPTVGRTIGAIVPILRVAHRHIVACETVMPSFSSSPWMRGAPQRKFARVVSSISCRVSRAIRGRRPRQEPRDRYLQIKRYSI
jgi:hypothetical protein